MTSKFNGPGVTGGIIWSGSMRLVLPWPPTVNTYYRSVNGRMMISERGRAYRKEVGQIVLMHRYNRHLSSKLSIEIEAFRPDNRKRDLDNVLKATLDSLTKAGVWEDDSQVVDIRIFWSKIKGSYIEVTIKEVEWQKS